MEESLVDQKGVFCSTRETVQGLRSSSGTWTVTQAAGVPGWEQGRQGCSTHREGVVTLDLGEGGVVEDLQLLQRSLQEEQPHVSEHQQQQATGQPRQQHRSRLIDQFRGSFCVLKWSLKLKKFR